MRTAKPILACIRLDSLTRHGILPAMDSAAQNALILLEWYRTAGADEAISTVPQDWFAASSPDGAALARETTPAALTDSPPRLERKPLLRPQLVPLAPAVVEGTSQSIMAARDLAR